MYFFDVESCFVTHKMMEGINADDMAITEMGVRAETGQPHQAAFYLKTRPNANH